MVLNVVLTAFTGAAFHSLVTCVVFYLSRSCAKLGGQEQSKLHKNLLSLLHSSQEIGFPEPHTSAAKLFLCLGGGGDLLRRDLPASSAKELRIDGRPCLKSCCEAAKVELGQMINPHQSLGCVSSSVDSSCSRVILRASKRVVQTLPEAFYTKSSTST